MKFEPKKVYHVYNQGNNHERLFLSDEHYLNFLSFFAAYVLPSSEILAWCLMPTHFHFMLYADDRCLMLKEQGDLLLDPITNGFRKLLSGYSHKFNKQNNRSGALFRPKTKSKYLQVVYDNNNALLPDYYSNCFHYIHNNPVKDGLVKHPSDWKWSSYNFYAGEEKEGFCNRSLAVKFGLCVE